MGARSEKPLIGIQSCLIERAWHTYGLSLALSSKLWRHQCSDISVRFLSSINACRLFTWHNVSSTIWLFCHVLRDSVCIEMLCCPPKDPLGYNQWEESRLREELLRRSMLGSNCPWGCPNRWFLGCWCCSDRCVCGKSPWVAWKGIRVRSEYRERKHHLRKLNREVPGSWKPTRRYCRPWDRHCNLEVDLTWFPPTLFEFSLLRLKEPLIQMLLSCDPFLWSGHAQRQLW